MIEFALDGLKVADMQVLLTADIAESSKILARVIKAWDFDADPGEPATYGNLDFFEEYRLLIRELIAELARKAEAVAVANPRRLTFDFDLAQMKVSEYEQIRTMSVVSPNFVECAEAIMRRVKPNTGSSKIPSPEPKLSSGNPLELDYFEEWVVLFRAFHAALAERAKK